MFFLLLSLGNTARHPLVMASSELVEYTRRDRKKGVLVNTPTLTWVYTKTFKDRGKKRYVTRLTSVVSRHASISYETGYGLSK
jgi:hypothetical protein